MEKIKTQSIVEIAGKPEKHVEETLNKMLNILEQNKKIKIIKKEIAPPQKVEFDVSKDKKVEVFSSFVDLVIEFPEIDELMQYLYVFMPSSIEIIEPELLSIKQKDIENSLNDLLARLHHQAKINMEYETLRQKITATKSKK